MCPVFALETSRVSGAMVRKVLPNVRCVVLSFVVLQRTGTCGSWHGCRATFSSWSAVVVFTCLRFEFPKSLEGELSTIFNKGWYASHDKNQSMT